MAKCTGVRCPMQYGYKVEECNHTDCPYRTEPITNADRIRAVSDEELGRILRVYLRTHALVLNIQTMQSAGYIGSNSLRNKKL